MTMQIDSAYNFVPLSRHVVQPDWQDRVSHDLPLAEGLCAELEVELQAHTPLLVGGVQQPASNDQPGQVGFYLLPDGRPAIPGSSLRGMLRNVLEIATCARMAPVMDDRALSLRDLSSSSNDYVRTLVDGAGLRDRSRGARPRARSGWLWFDGEQWRLEVAECSRVEQDLIKRHFGLRDDKWPSYADTETRRRWRLAAGQKRKCLIEATERNPAVAMLRDGHLHVRFSLRPQVVHQHRDKWLAYRKVERFGAMRDTESDLVEGVLVCTGQPGPGKHMEFVFSPFSRHSDSLVVPDDVMAEFHQVHDAPDGEWQRLWRGFAAQRLPVPVFYLGAEAAGDPGLVARLGLAQMFRLPGRHRLGEIAARSQQHNGAKLQDFVQTLFGHVLAEQCALKGRVAVGDFVPLPGTKPEVAEVAYRQPTVLSGPKPGFYPNYFRQDQNAGQLKPNANFATILSAEPPTLSGWKRYPVRPAEKVHVPPPPERSRPKVQVQLCPLAAGCRFRGTIRLHNVRPEELGAMLWALDFGEPPADDHAVPALRHALGMGKPFGFGQVSLRLCAPLRVRPNDAQAAPPAAADLRSAFEAYMESQVPGWRHGGVLRELRAMADPQHPAATSGQLTPPNDPKKFMEFKKQHVRAALVPHSQRTARR